MMNKNIKAAIVAHQLKSITRTICDLCTIIDRWRIWAEVHGQEEKALLDFIDEMQKCLTGSDKDDEDNEDFDDDEDDESDDK